MSCSRAPSDPRWFAPEGDFPPLPAPSPGDWLAEHPESGQTFEQFLRSQPRRPDERRHVLYLQPLGEFRQGESLPLDPLRRFAAAFFAMDVKVLPPLDLRTAPVTERFSTSGQRQLLTHDILRLLGRQLPADGFAILGITMEDLYPDPAWNFVFGQASPRLRAGIYSFARYDPRAYGEAPADWRRLLLWRSCKVLAHETSHMFGIEHCVYYRCVMNGANHLQEFDSQPLHLCPVDLRKLQHRIGFDVLDRDRNLLAFSRDAGFDEEARWLERHIAHLKSFEN